MIALLKEMLPPGSRLHLIAAALAFLVSLCLMAWAQDLARTERAAKARWKAAQETVAVVQTARSQEAAAVKRQLTAMTRAAKTEHAADAIVSHAVAAATEASDADVSLALDRIDRLKASDEAFCRLAALQGCPSEHVSRGVE